MRNLSLCLFVALLAGCSRGAVNDLPVSGPSNASAVTRGAAGSDSFHLLYRFKISPDGAFPLAPLVQANGAFYGTTSQGGSANASGDGTVFKITPAGLESVLYSFQGAPDGQFPQAGLISLNGLFYGTTPGGGANNNGSVFTVAPSGSEKVIYSFQTGTDGAAPTAALTNLNGTLYGTTSVGGGTSCADGLGCGTVFSIDPAGNETVLYRFQGGTDGQLPAAGLINVNGTLYGTTFFGGGTNCNFKGCGTVFKITPDGNESTVYAFQGGSDGANPNAGLVNLNGALYGTTSSGSNSNNGTIFKIGTAGKERILHRFNRRKTGADPEAGLIAVNGVLYGTTFAGGTQTLGVIFKITQAGDLTVLHNFTGPDDGANPSAALILFNGTLYGTAKTGGPAGNGTVFSIAP